MIPDWLPIEQMYRGFTTTFALAGVSVILSTVIGSILGVLVTLPFLPLRGAIRLYVEVWRGLPLIVTLFFIFFALPILGLLFSSFIAATIGLTLWGSANVAEAVRGAVQSIPRAQSEGAAALGMNWVQSRVFIIFPQAFRRLIPPLLGQIANIIQNTTLAAVIGVVELLQASQRSVETLTFTVGESHSILIMGMVLVVFFLICFPLGRLARYLERRLVV